MGGIVQNTRQRPGNSRRSWHRGAPAGHGHASFRFPCPTPTLNLDPVRLSLVSKILPNKLGAAISLKGTERGCAHLGQSLDGGSAGLISPGTRSIHKLSDHETAIAHAVEHIARASSDLQCPRTNAPDAPSLSQHKINERCGNKVTARHPPYTTPAISNTPMSSH